MLPVTVGQIVQGDPGTVRRRAGKCSGKVRNGGLSSIVARGFKVLADGEEWKEAVVAWPTVCFATICRSETANGTVLPGWGMTLGDARPRKVVSRVPAPA